MRGVNVESENRHLFGETVGQSADETRFVVDCKVNPVAFVGHDRMTFAPAEVMVSCGGVNGKEMLKIVPLLPLPSQAVAP